MFAYWSVSDQKNSQLSTVFTQKCTAEHLSSKQTFLVCQTKTKSVFSQTQKKKSLMFSSFKFSNLCWITKWNNLIIHHTINAYLSCRHFNFGLKWVRKENSKFHSHSRPLSSMITLSTLIKWLGKNVKCDVIYLFGWVLKLLLELFSMQNRTEGIEKDESFISSFIGWIQGWRMFDFKEVNEVFWSVS